MHLCGMNAKIHTDHGTMTVEFFEKDAPNTVANFVKLANEGFYEGLKFHRVISGFVAQGGCPQGIGSGGPLHHRLRARRTTSITTRAC